MKNKGISNLLSYITISIVILIIGFSIYYIFFQQAKYGQQIITKEERNAESQLAERLSLIYWGVDGAIIANDGENPIIITKIYVDNQIIITNIVINPTEKKQINIPYGKNLMIESSSGNLIKIERPKPTMTEPYSYSETQETEISQMSSESSQQTSQTYSKTTYTSTMITEIPIQTYSYKTITSTSYSTTTTTSTSTYISYIGVWPYTTIYYITTITKTLTYEYTLTLASLCTTTKTTTYTTIIDPIIKNAYPMFNNANTFLISMFLLIFAIIYSIVLLKKVVK